MASPDDPFRTISRAITPALNRARAQVLSQLIPDLERLGEGELVRRLTIALGAAYIDGVQAAVAAHGYLGLNPTVVRNQLTRALTAMVLDAIARARQRLIDQVATRYAGGITVHQLGARILNAVQQTVWTGHDEEARSLAVMASVEWKVWRRSFAREEHRDWHDDLNGVMIPVDEDFTMPSGPNAGAKVYGPRDWDSLPDPREWMNCGHALEFRRTAAVGDLAETALVYRPQGTTQTDAQIRAARTR